jgi:Tfp pilus assembly protein PilN
MIQFNLLPDVKVEYLKAQRQRRLVFSVSIIVSVLAVVLLGLLYSYDGLQKKHLNDISTDIITASTKLKSEPNINGILTVQNQLESLTALHQGKPAVTNLFTYLNQVTPTSCSIASIAIDFTADTMTLSGNANSLSAINQFVDTLKDTTYTTTDNTTATPAFSNVVLSSFGVTAAGGGSSATNAYDIDFSYDPTIFDITKTVTLTVPNQVSDRSSDLFQVTSSTTGGTQ